MINGFVSGDWMLRALMLAAGVGAVLALIWLAAMLVDRWMFEQ